MIAPEWKILSETSSIQVDIFFFFLFKKQFTIIFISNGHCNDVSILMKAFLGIWTFLVRFLLEFSSPK